MRSNAGMAKEDVGRRLALRFAQVSALRTLAWPGLAWLGLAWLSKKPSKTYKTVIVNIT
jgi:hypothetical protein